MVMQLRSKNGFTFVEVLVALGITAILFGSLCATFLAVKSLNAMARHKMQAIQVVRGQIEALKSQQFSTLANAVVMASYDAGEDGIFDNADDMQGTLSTNIQDLMDFDGDGNTAETAIDLDGAGGNDAGAVPVRVSFGWDEYVIGQTRNMAVSMDTIIAQ